MIGFSKEYLVSVIQYLKNLDSCSEIKEYKGIHKGKRCFIVGTGPSLRMEDLDSIKEEYSFGSNRIYEVFSKTDWRPTYYMNQDYRLIENTVENIRAIDVKRKFLPIEAKKFFLDESNISFFVLRHKEFYPGLADFSKHINHYLGQGFTVTYGAIQMAYYMGFSKVYLLGIDHNYSISLDEKGNPIIHNDVKDYFRGSTASNIGLNLPRVVESTLAYVSAKKFADKHNGFEVFNATRGGHLEVFQRVNFDDVLHEDNV